MKSNEDNKTWISNILVRNIFLCLKQVYCCLTFVCVCIYIKIKPKTVEMIWRGRSAMGEGLQWFFSTIADLLERKVCNGGGKVCNITPASINESCLPWHRPHWGSGSVILLRPKIGLASQKHDVISMPRQQYTNTKHIPIESYHLVVSIMPRHMDPKKIFSQNLCCREVKIDKISGGDLPYFSLKCDNLP